MGNILAVWAQLHENIDATYNPLLLLKNQMKNGANEEVETWSQTADLLIYKPLLYHTHCILLTVVKNEMTAISCAVI